MILYGDAPGRLIWLKEATSFLDESGNAYIKMADNGG